MELALIPEQHLLVRVDYDHIRKLQTGSCKLNAEFMEDTGGVRDQKDLGRDPKRLCKEPKKTLLSFTITVHKNGENTTMECHLTTVYPETCESFQKFYFKLPRHATANLSLTLSTEASGQLLEIQDKLFEFGKHGLWLQQCIESFDLATEDNPHCEINGKICVTLSRGNTTIEKGKHTLAMCTSILKNMEHADVKIVTSNGSKILCHKAFLTAQSSFFQRMFASGMKEAVSDNVTLDDISEAGVRAMLDYIYCGEIEKAKESCEIAFELLIAGDQYGIPNLEKVSKNLLINQPPDWFSIAIAFDIWQFANKKTRNENNDNYKCLEEKVLAVLKTKPENEIKECPAFTKLLENPEAGIVEFCFCLLKNVGLAPTETESPEKALQGIVSDNRGRHNNKVGIPETQIIVRIPTRRHDSVQLERDEVADLLKLHLEMQNRQR